MRMWLAFLAHPYHYWELLRLRPFFGMPFFLKTIRSLPRKRRLALPSALLKGNGLSGWLI